MTTRKQSCENIVARPVLPERLDWSSTIGLFIINFGALEMALTTLLQRRLGAKHSHAVVKNSFHEKVLRLRNLVEKLPDTAARKEGWRTLIERLNAMRDLRNHLAHSTFVATFTEDGSVVQALSLISAVSIQVQEARVVTFDELFQELSSLNDIISELLKIGEFPDVT